ncbi:MAG: PoNe immunity protein domain-containing protein [Burkholderiaceae bacterium]
MGKREPLLTEEFFVNRLAYLDRIVVERNERLAKEPEVYIHPKELLWSNFRGRYQQIFLGYSLDEGLPRLAQRFPAVVETYEIYLRDKEAVPTDLADLDEYIVSLWLVSFAILFKVDDDLWKRLLACIGNEGRDALFEALVATRSPNRRKAAGLLHAAIFQPLHDAIAADAKSRDALVKRYLKAWYKALKPTYWVDSHKGPKGGGFFGYWAVEVAGVVQAFGMDDTGWRDMPYYPADLVTRA